ncbi:chromate efflux transporter [Clostridium pasteurianum]|uniref:Chromate transporter, chromate ion transporter family n=1 Tax=Clostridium pasteurianum BC1 TaxID=86416 RepID=R4K4S6_CLOPA|nr:chromate efflux transporter [Clostridium pasteurianum]AGK96726.1 chromate transporter, chromate ion transporter family [Clostridium pasteurianum BC1]
MCNCGCQHIELTFKDKEFCKEQIKKYSGKIKKLSLVTSDKNYVETNSDINLMQIFLLFFKIGFTAFGPSMIIETKKHIVKKLKWINEKELLEGLALAQLIPGATFVSLAIYIGYKLKGLLGAIASFIGFIFAPFFIMLVLSLLYFKYENIAFVNVLFKGLGAVVVALILNAVCDLARTTTTNIQTIIIAVTAFIISILYNNIFFILFISALMGIMLIPKSTEDMKNTYIIEKTKIQWKNIIIICITILIFFILTAFNKELLSIAGTFFKIGTLAFGNGFTMIPLIQQEVVNTNHWLNLNQFMVGVALGQMTPGPVTITATFIGYKVMGLIGAVVGTLSIYASSFLFVVITFRIYTKIKKYTWTNSVLSGLLSSFVGIMTLVVINTGRHAIIDIYTLILFVLSFIMLQFTKLDSKLVILGGTILYLIIYYLK